MMLSLSDSNHRVRAGNTTTMMTNRHRRFRSGSSSSTIRHRHAGMILGRTKSTISFLSLLAIIMTVLFHVMVFNNNNGNGIAMFFAFVESTSSSTSSSTNNKVAASATPRTASNTYLVHPQKVGAVTDDPISLQDPTTSSTYGDDAGTSSDDDDDEEEEEDTNITNSTTRSATASRSTPLVVDDDADVDQDRHGTTTSSDDGITKPTTTMATIVVNNGTTSPATQDGGSILSRESDSWKRNLPFPLNNKTKSLQRIVFEEPPTTVNNSNSNNNNTNSQIRSGNGRNSGCIVEVYLLGTAHVSNDSSNDVKLLLETIQPDIIFVELCYQRAPMLVTIPSPSNTTTTITTKVSATTNTATATATAPTIWGRLQTRWERSFWGKRRIMPTSSSPSSSSTDDERPTSTATATATSSSGSSNMGNGMFTKATTLLTSLQQDTADSLGVEVGGEFRVAYNYWYTKRKELQIKYWKDHQYQTQQQQQEIQSHIFPQMVLGDRSFQCTLLRAWESLSWWGKIRLVCGLLISSLSKPNPDEIKAWMKGILDDDGSDLLTKSMEELSKAFPTLSKVIIHERDVYMSCKIYQTCQHLFTMGNLYGDRDDTDTPTIPSTTTSTTTLPRPKRYTVVVIVGAGHIEGMYQWLSTTTTTATATPTSIVNENVEETLYHLVTMKSRSSTKEEVERVIHDVPTVDAQYMEEIAQQMKEQQHKQ
jgi:pheromone shutdown protein TraB